ncbi:MAG TPA: acetate--CoA ligase family protein, partial [Anaerolineaceae bacterium]|nr:acetate--CoA ligase family protein [Anaerolineaceae bacterium]
MDPKTLSPFFNAKGVAILGASSKPNKLSYGILENLLQYGYQGEVYPINPNAESILGKKAYPSISDVPDPVELAVIVLPVGMVLESLEQCGERGIKAVTIVTGGFREVGESGKKLEEQCMEIAHRFGMRIIGPNCVGTIAIHTGLNSTFIKGMPDLGPIAFISQSGAICGGVVDLVLESHFGFSYFTSLGNEMDVTETDMLEYVALDPQVKVIAMYIEEVKDGPRFMEVARKVSSQKPIVLLKAGKNNAGAKAISSHTGSMAGSYTAYQAAFKQSGVIEVDTLADLFNLAWAFGCQDLPAGNKVAIATNAGGAAALASDALALNGMDLATISPEIQSTLRTKLNPSAQVSNPIDMLGGAEPQDYEWALGQASRDPNVDALHPILVPQSLVDTMGVAQAWVRASKETKKTFMACLMGAASAREATAYLNQQKVPAYQYPDQGPRVLGGMLKYKKILATGSFEPMSHSASDSAKQAVNEILAVGAGSFGEEETRKILQAYEIPVVPGDLAGNVDEAVQIAERVGYPVVLKISAEGILHKSDAGGIVLNLKNAQELRVAYSELILHIQEIAPTAQIHGAMVERMAPKGLELIIGIKRDATFGPMVLFGSGGVLVEMFKDVAVGIAPLSKVEILELIGSTAAGKMIQGFRGSAKLDQEALVQIISRLAQLALDHREIQEIEINPLILYPEGQGA